MLSSLLLALLLGAPGRTSAATYFEPWSPCHEHRGRGKRALVTGITGMLGSHIAEALLRRGYEVYGVIRARSNVRNIASFSANITVLTAELTDSWHTVEIIKDVNPHYIFHFAAQAFNSMSYSEPAYTLNTNVMSTLNILEAVRQLKQKEEVRILIAGSSTVYGSSTEEWDGPIPETAALQPVSPYGVSKAATELLAQQYGRTHGLHIVVPRFFIHLAPRGVEALALHQFAHQVALIERGLQEPVIRHGDISTQRDITDIVDSAPVVVCLAESAPRGTVVNVGSNVTYAIRDLLERALQMSSVRGIRLQADQSRLRLYDERIVMADITKLKALTGWRPQPDIDSLIHLLLEYWRREIAFRYPSDPAPRARGSEL
mmetsp:Transcript_49334/g.139249  ORF Transcript_49334/g.139249 Transcript_49334/m.139249 type:complete len:374 (+) Transcript_49334:1-1122(+)